MGDMNGNRTYTSPLSAFCPAVSLFLSLSLILSGCSGGSAARQLGLERAAPDEFAIVKRAPLEMPPDYYTLRPPRPGAARPQEQSPETRARQSVFGAAQSSAVQTGAQTGDGTSSKPAEEHSYAGQRLSYGEAILLQKTGAARPNPQIREIVDSETRTLAEENKPTIDRILSLTGQDYTPPASVVDAPAELERLRKNAGAGKPVTEGETPIIEE